MPPSDQLGFELRLAPHEARVDLIQFLPGTAWPEYFDGVYHEYDLAGGHDITPDPALFFAFPARHDGLDAEIRIKAMRQVLEQSPAHGLPPALRQRAEAILGALAATARLKSFGLMQSRQPASLRLNLSVSGGEDIEPLLGSLQCRSSWDRLRAFFKSCSLNPDHHIVSLDVGARGLSDRVGIEVSLRGEQVSKALPGLLAGLQRSGACSAAKAEAALAFPQLLTPPGAERDWPDRFLLQSLEMREDEFSAVLAHLTHLKVTASSDEPPSGKLYLACRHITSKIWRSASPSPACELREAR